MPHTVRRAAILVVGLAVAASLSPVVAVPAAAQSAASRPAPVG